MSYFLIKIAELNPIYTFRVYPLKLYLLLISVVLSYTCSFGQNSEKTYSLEEALKNLAASKKVNIIFDSELVDGFNISKSPSSNLSVGDALRMVLTSTNIGFITINDIDFYLVPTKNLSQDIQVKASVNSTATEEAISRTIAARNELLKTLTGKIIDGSSQVGIPGASIVVENGAYFTTTATDGTFTLSIPTGKSTVDLRSFGYEPYSSQIITTEDLELTFELFQESKQLNEVIVYADQFSDRISRPSSGLERVSIKSIEEQPTFMGEVDIIKSITSLPGVGTSGEGSNGFNVRGGNSDENLVLYDHIPIYNTGHLLGFMSVFNPDMIQSFSLYKGGTPSYYGGRSSSVFLIEARDGSKEKRKINVSAGSILSRVSVESPFAKGKGSIIMGYRAAYPEWLIQLIPDKNVSKSKATFNDLNSKISYSIDNKRSISATIYRGTDLFSLASDTSFQWNNFGMSIRYNKIINSAKSLEIIATKSNYNNNISGNQPFQEFKYSNFINQHGLKANYSIISNKSQVIDFGSEINLYQLNSGKLTPNAPESSINPFLPQQENGMEIMGYISGAKDINTALKMEAGMRIGGFFNIGGGDQLNYVNNNNPEIFEVSDTLSFGKYEPHDFRLLVEPRISVSYQINNRNSLKAGIQTMSQNIHLISNSLSIAPTDYWKLNNSYLRPTRAHQINLGFHSNRLNYYFYSELFYKKTIGIIDYRDGARIFLNSQIETALINTKGDSWGSEWKIEKRGKLNGWISYSYVHSTRNFNTGNRLDNQVGSDKYLSDFNRPHQLNISANYKLGRKISLSGNFVFNSGRPLTVPAGAYLFNNRLFPQYGYRNEESIPNYHRLDLSMTLKGNLKKEKLFDGDFIFSVYNVYARKNAYSVFFKTTDSGILPQSYQLSILGSAFPSITYRFTIAELQ